MFTKIKRVKRTLFNEKPTQDGFFNTENFRLQAYRTKKQQRNMFFSVVIPKSVASKAHLRNLIKRRIRSIVYSIKPENINKGVVIIFVKKNIANMKFPLIHKEINELLLQSKVLMPKIE